MHIGETNVGEIIRILRIEREMSREKLAELAGISLSHMNKIEAGIKQPGINTYQKIMSVLEADVIIRDEENTEKGKCVAKAREILMRSSEKQAKYLVKVLECVSKNLDMVS